MDMWVYNRGDDPEKGHWKMPRPEWYGEATWRDLVACNEQIAAEDFEQLGYTTSRLALPEVHNDADGS